MAGDLSAAVQAIISNVDQVVRGKQDQIRLAVCCLLTEGHLLIDDVPGTGKTSLAKAIAGWIAGKWTRVQFTPDLLPTEVTGVSTYDQRAGTFTYREGPVFTNILTWTPGPTSTSSARGSDTSRPASTSRDGNRRGQLPLHERGRRPDVPCRRRASAGRAAASVSRRRVPIGVARVSILFIVPPGVGVEPGHRTGHAVPRRGSRLRPEVGLDPGLPFESDEVTVDVRRFEAFARRLLDDYVAADGVERALGELRHRYPVVILDRAGRRLPATNAEQTAALHWARGEFGGIPN